jgi:hypothetical protein
MLVRPVAGVATDLQTVFSENQLSPPANGKKEKKKKKKESITIHELLQRPPACNRIQNVWLISIKLSVLGLH